MKTATFSLAFLVGGVVGILGLTVSGALADPLKIMCIGDSITAGNTNAPTWTVPYTFGYRGPLYTKLKAAGYDFQFVGSSGEPWNLPYGEAFGVPATSVIQGPDLRAVGQDNHRGYAGVTTSQILNGGSAGGSTNTFPSIVDMISTDDPDIVLLMIGINGRPDAIANIGALVKGIVTTKPGVKLIIAQITPRTSTFTPPLNLLPPSDIARYNNYIKNVVMPNYPSDQYNVTLVDQYSGFIKSDGTVDTSLVIDDYYVHLTPAGNELVAQVWFDGIQRVAPAPEPTTSSLLGRTGHHAGCTRVLANSPLAFAAATGIGANP